MKKVFVFLILLILTLTITARYTAPYDPRDTNTIEYYPEGITGDTPTAYGTNESQLDFINGVFPSFKNINLTTDGNITITPNKLLSTIKIGLNKDLNLTIVNITDLNVTGDANFANIGISKIIFGSNANLDLNISNDVYLSNDLNVLGSILAGKYFGDGSGLTGVLTYTDANQHYVPYIDGIFDVNLGIYRLTANDLNAMNLGIENNAYILGNLNVTGDINATNITALDTMCFDINCSTKIYRDPINRDLVITVE